MSFHPYEPQLNSTAGDWLKAIHRETYQRNKVLRTPDALVSHTTQGVIHRPKLIEVEEEEIKDDLDF